MIATLSSFGIGLAFTVLGLLALTLAVYLHDRTIKLLDLHEKRLRTLDPGRLHGPVPFRRDPRA